MASAVWRNFAGAPVRRSYEFRRVICEGRTLTSYASLPGSGGFLPRLSLASLHRPLARVGHVLSRIVATNPWLWSCFAYGSRYAVGDAVTQVGLERQELDRKRTVCFFMFGFFYANVAFAVLCRLYPRLGWGAKTMTLTEVFVHYPLLYFPSFYVAKEVIMSDAPLRDCPANGIRKYLPNFWKDMAMGSMFWIPVNAGMFALVPVHMRVMTQAVVGSLWALILSYTRGAMVEEDGHDDSKVRSVTDLLDGLPDKIVVDLNDLQLPAVDLNVDAMKLKVDLNPSDNGSGDTIGGLAVSAFSEVTEENLGDYFANWPGTTDIATHTPTPGSDLLPIPN